MMEKSGAVIVLALEKYAQYIDHDIENYNRDLNIQVLSNQIPIL